MKPLDPSDPSDPLAALAALGTTPLPDEPLVSPATTEYLAYLQDLIDDPEVYGYAVDTLAGIHQTITARGHVTDSQRQAVRNIVSGAWEGRETRARATRSRRYEGFEGHPR